MRQLESRPGFSMFPSHMSHGLIEVLTDQEKHRNSRVDWNLGILEFANGIRDGPRMRNFGALTALPRWWFSFLIVF